MSKDFYVSPEDTVVNPQWVVDTGYMTGRVEQCLVQPNSLDLTVKDVYEIEGILILQANGERRLPSYTPLSPTTEQVVVCSDGRDHIQFLVNVYKLVPGVTYQVEFEQVACLPSTIVGLTFPRSSMSKSGANCECGVFDSGYKGDCGMTLQVSQTCFIERGAAVAQMIFLRADSSRDYQGYYQDKNGSWRTQD
jgi:dUTP pyrophosphatase